MSAKPRVSIVIPCYNAGRMLSHCLESCIAQTYKNLEVIFVDNNSDDGSLAYAEQVAESARGRIRVTRCLVQGRAPAKNHGFGLATGDYIQWLDADDQLMPEKIERQVAFLEAHPEVSIAWCPWVFGQSRGKRRVDAPGRRAGPFDDELTNLLLNYWRPPLSYLMRRSMAERVASKGGWNPEALYSDDREYFTNAALLGAVFARVDARVRYNKWSPSQITANVDFARQAEDMRRKFEHFSVLAEDDGRCLTGTQRRLLALDWNLYQLPPSGLSSEADGSSVRMRTGSGGGVMLGGEHVKPIVGALSRIARRGPWTLERLLERIRDFAPPLRGHDLEVYDVLEQLRDHGVLETYPPGAPTDVMQPFEQHRTPA